LGRRTLAVERCLVFHVEHQGELTKCSTWNIFVITILYVLTREVVPSVGVST
jgi:hypothetical protein